MASLMFLGKPLNSLCTMEKQSGLIGCPVFIVVGDSNGVEAVGLLGICWVGIPFVVVFVFKVLLQSV